MKARCLLLTFAAVAGLFVSCKPKDEPISPPSLSIAPGSLAFEKAAASQTLKVTASRDWNATTDADWISVSPTSGKASKDAQTVTISVLENTGLDREGSVKFDIGFDSKSLAVTQNGMGSAEDLIVYKNDFDKEAATKKPPRKPMERTASIGRCSTSSMVGKIRRGRAPQRLNMPSPT